MKIETVELRRISLPLIAPFRVSFGVEHHRDILLVRVVAGEVEGWGECVAMSRPLYSPEYVDGAEDVIRRHLLPRLFDAGDVAADRVGGDPPPDPRSSDGEGGARDGRPRCRAASRRRLARRPSRRGAHRGRLRRLGRHPRRSGRARRGCRRLPRGGLPPHQAQDRARLRRRVRQGRTRAVPGDPPAGRRQHRLHARRRLAAGEAGRVRAASDRAAPSGGRRARACRAGAPRPDADLSRRVDHLGAVGRRRHRSRRVPHRQHQGRPGRRLPRGAPGARRLRGERRPGLVRRHARDRSRSRRQRRAGRAPQLHAPRRHLRLRPLLRTGHHRALRPPGRAARGSAGTGPRRDTDPGDPRRAHDLARDGTPPHRTSSPKSRNCNSSTRRSSAFFTSMSKSSTSRRSR